MLRTVVVHFNGKPQQPDAIPESLLGQLLHHLLLLSGASFGKKHSLAFSSCGIETGRRHHRIIMCQKDSSQPMSVALREEENQVAVEAASTEKDDSEVVFHSFWNHHPSDTDGINPKSDSPAESKTVKLQGTRNRTAASKEKNSEDVPEFWNHPDPQYNTIKLSLPKELQDEIIQYRRKRLTFRQRAKRAAVTVGGSTLLGMGTALLFTPIHPVGHLFQAGGVGVLATEYDVMKKHKEKASKSFHETRAKAAGLFKPRKKKEDLLAQYEKEGLPAKEHSKVQQQLIEEAMRS
eukprot:scaffold22680_cov107-Cylindrotheca_fusiformis.AAC.4